VRLEPFVLAGVALVALAPFASAIPLGPVPPPPVCVAGVCVTLPPVDLPGPVCVTLPAQSLQVPGLLLWVPATSLPITLNGQEIARVDLPGASVAVDPWGASVGGSVVCVGLPPTG